MFTCDCTKDYTGVYCERHGEEFISGAFLGCIPKDTSCCIHAYSTEECNGGYAWLRWLHRLLQ